MIPPRLRAQHLRVRSRGQGELIRMKTLLAFSFVTFLPGCSMVVLDPSGYIAAQEARLLVIATVLMLLIIVPVIALTLVFAWRYRASNTDAPYEPEWDHSIQLELVIWSAPLLIIIALGAITWIGTHTLNPYRPLDTRSAPTAVEPLDIQVVALDWKWLFIYPDEGIAVVNELAAPVDVPVHFSITSSSVMNSFFVPALAGQIYAMPTMETTLHAVINRPGEYEGFSANYSGAGFSGMRFKFFGMNDADFERWVQKAKASGQALGRDGYVRLERPSEGEPVRLYGTVAPGLFDAVVNRCVAPGSQCLHAVMAADARRAAAALNWRPDAAFVCTAADPVATASLPVAERK
ncbi:MAG: cyoA [Ramlibacter sp.]|nr:cyoA [Ramlibacter sp.]